MPLLRELIDHTLVNRTDRRAKRALLARALSVATALAGCVNARALAPHDSSPPDAGAVARDARIPTSDASDISPPDASVFDRGRNDATRDVAPDARALTDTDLNDLPNDSRGRTPERDAARADLDARTDGESGRPDSDIESDAEAWVDTSVDVGLDRGSDAGVDARIAEDLDAGADAGVDRCAVLGPGMLIGSGRVLTTPTLAAHASGVVLIAWTEAEVAMFATERIHRALMILRAADGTTSSVAEVAPMAAGHMPASRATSIETLAGFAVAWVENWLDDGSPRYALRYVEVTLDGRATRDELFATGPGLRFSDVAPRLIPAFDGVAMVARLHSSTLMVYGPESAGTTAFAFGSGETASVCGDGSAVHRVDVVGDEFVLTTRTARGVTSSRSIARPGGIIGGAPVLHCLSDGFLLSQIPKTLRVTRDGAPRGEILEETVLCDVAERASDGELAVIDRRRGRLSRFDLGMNLVAEHRLGVETLSGGDALCAEIVWSGMQYVFGWKDRRRDESAWRTVCE